MSGFSFVLGLFIFGLIIEDGLDNLAKAISELKAK